jgi:hypothetical protein
MNFTEQERQLQIDILKNSIKLSIERLESDVLAPVMEKYHSKRIERNQKSLEELAKSVRNICNAKN